MIDAARAYAGAEWSLFPLRGKVPATRHGVNDATTDADQIDRWWGENPDANIGVACGPSRLVVIDLDHKNAVNGWTTWLALCDRYAPGGIEPRTFEVDTPTGGGHKYFAACDREVRNSAGKLGEGIDVRAAGGYEVAPPSRMDSAALGVVAGGGRDDVGDPPIQRSHDV